MAFNSFGTNPYILAVTIEMIMYDHVYNINLWFTPALLSPLLLLAAGIGNESTNSDQSELSIWHF